MKLFWTDVCFSKAEININKNEPVEIYFVKGVKLLFEADLIFLVETKSIEKENVHMKINTPKIILIGTVLLAGLSACKKVDNNNTSGSNTNTKTRNVNPNTATAICDYDKGDTALTNHGWTRSFNEEFNGALSNWNIVHGGLTQELQCYEPGNVAVNNGVLQINAKQENVNGPKTVGNDTSQAFNYTSGWVYSQQTFAANSSTAKVRIVARVKVASGYGLTSLVWGFGDGEWPLGGEIDVAEVQGDNPKAYSTDYAYGLLPHLNAVNNAFLLNPTTEDLSECYHVFVLEWSKNTLTSYIDGSLVETKTVGDHIPDLFGKPQHISFSLPVGGLYYPTLNPANIKTGTLSVDYVKVFTSN